MSQRDGGEPPDAALDRTLSDLERSAAAAISAIEETPEPNRAFERATALREVIDRMVGEAAELRARMAARIFESEKMSLATLADRIGVSKSRADQFIRSAKASPQGKVDQDG